MFKEKIKKYEGFIFFFLLPVISFVSCLIIIFIIGIETGQGNEQAKLEQKLCQLKQYEFCTKEELLKAIK